MVADGRFDELLEADQLRLSIVHGDAFVGFDEGEMHFPPTFKVERKAGEGYYKSQRTPSYCDRVLWKSMPPAKGLLTQEMCTAVPATSTSDHKPVVALFKLCPSVALPASLSVQCNLKLSRLTLHDLSAADFTGTSGDAAARDSTQPSRPSHAIPFARGRPD